MLFLQEMRLLSVTDEVYSVCVLLLQMKSNLCVIVMGNIYCVCVIVTR